jgi:hypothetical protein
VGDKRGFSKAMTASFGLRVIFFYKNAKMEQKNKSEDVSTTTNDKRQATNTTRQTTLTVPDFRNRSVI